MAFCFTREKRGTDSPARGVALVKSLVSCCIDEAGVRGDTVACCEVPGWPDLSRTVCYLVPPPRGNCPLWLFFFSFGDADGVGGGGRQEAKGCSVESRLVKQDLGVGPAVESIISLHGVSSTTEMISGPGTPRPKTGGGAVTLPQAAVKAMGDVPSLPCQGAPSSQLGG